MENSGTKCMRLEYIMLGPPKANQCNLWKMNIFPSGINPNQQQLILVGEGVVLGALQGFTFFPMEKGELFFIWRNSSSNLDGLSHPSFTNSYNICFPTCELQFHVVSCHFVWPLLYICMFSTVPNTCWMYCKQTHLSTESFAFFK